MGSPFTITGCGLIASSIKRPQLFCSASYAGQAVQISFRILTMWADASLSMGGRSAMDRSQSMTVKWQVGQRSFSLRRVVVR